MLMQVYPSFIKLVEFPFIRSERVTRTRNHRFLEEGQHEVLIRQSFQLIRSNYLLKLPHHIHFLRPLL